MRWFTEWRIRRLKRELAKEEGEFDVHYAIAKANGKDGLPSYYIDKYTHSKGRIAYLAEHIAQLTQKLEQK